MRQFNKTTIFLILAILFASFGVAVAVYEITSNIVTVTVSAPQAQLTLATSATAITLGESITLTATLNDFANGVVVTFYDGTTNVGQTNTTGGGIATLQLTPSIGTHNYKAIATHP